jgi:hypothetical protein
MASPGEDRTLVNVGCPIFAAEGERIGKVKAVQGPLFKVDAPGGPDYWLSNTVIASADHRGLYLCYDAEVVSRMAVTPPVEQ